MPNGDHRGCWWFLLAFSISFAPRAVDLRGCLLGDTCRPGRRWLARFHFSLFRNAAADGDEIIVGPGVYNTTINFNGKAITLRSENVNDPGLTTINGGAAGSVVTFNAGEGPDSKLAGFTIVNGAANSGGGAFVGVGTNPTIENCSFEGSQAQNGGGIAVFGQVTLRECWFLGNVANTSGGGLYTPTTTSNATLHACRFEGNDSPIGAAMRIVGPATVVNTEVFDNVNGPAVTISGSAPVSLINCNVVNHATAGIALNAGATSPTTIANCIVVNNAAQITGAGALLNVRFSNVQGGFAGPGNINVNPQFVDRQLPPAANLAVHRRRRERLGACRGDRRLRRRRPHLRSCKRG
jgi:predicted outer membrane repeat protein